MPTSDQLTDEYRAIVLFLEIYFEQQGMHIALAILRNPGTKVDDLRAVIDGYRHLYLREHQ